MVSSQTRPADFRTVGPPALKVQNSGADVTVVESTTPAIATVSGGSVPANLGNADEIWFDINIRINAGLPDGGSVPDHVHDMAGHVHSVPDHQHDVQVFGGFAETPGVDVVNTSGGVLGKGGGGDFSQATTAAGAGDTGGPSPSDTGAAGAGSVTLMGPFNLHIVFEDAAGNPYEIVAVPIWYMRTGKSIRVTQTYPFGWKGSSPAEFTPTAIYVKLHNQALVTAGHVGDVTIDNANTYVDVYTRSLTRFSTV